MQILYKADPCFLSVLHHSSPPVAVDFGRSSRRNDEETEDERERNKGKSGQREKGERESHMIINYIFNRMKNCISKVLLIFLMMIMMTTIAENKVVSADSWPNNINNRQANISFVLEDHMVEKSLLMDDPVVVVSLSLDFSSRVLPSQNRYKQAVQCPPRTRYTSCLQQQKFSPNLPRCNIYNRDRRCNQ